MGRRRTCYCDACPKCRRRAIRLAKARGEPPPPPLLLRPTRPSRTTVEGHAVLTAEERAELRRQIDEATRRKPALASVEAAIERKKRRGARRESPPLE